MNHRIRIAAPLAGCPALVALLASGCAFARELTRTPGAITREDAQSLETDFGADPALLLRMYARRCNDTVRASNGFQPSPERDNVFYDHDKMAPPSAAAATRR